MRKLLVVIALISCTLCGAQEKSPRHLVRLGWGDMLFETLAFHPTGNTSGYGYTGHVFADYHYSLTRVVSVGAQIDFQGIFWTEDASRRSRNYDLCILPSARFTWLDKPWVRLYSGLGAGVLFAFDNAGEHAALPVFNLNSIGVQIGKGRWSGFIDLGFMVAIKNVSQVYMVGSRLVSVGVNYRW
ncbi:MAG: hypothetical protein J6M31_06770 [Bacteroidales bacterium]|nr:hypothetical protein [Bacteroidales bacterium]